MEKKKIMLVFGTRPDSIKMIPVVNALKADERFETIVCVTAQHRQMLDQVLEIFNCIPDYDLDIMKERQTLFDITSRVITGLGTVIQDSKPDMVLVHGDTTTGFAAALASFYNKVPVGHVEAGLRTYDMYSPFPEEMNRKLIGSIASLHFSPTEKNVNNLLKEGIENEKIYKTGNTVIDALQTTVKDDFVFEEDVLNNIDYKSKKVIVMTAHRRENLGKPLVNICNAMKRIAESYPGEVEIVYPVHLNPEVKNTAHEILDGIANIHLVDPLDVAELHNLMARSYLVATDSGGIQEEAPSLGKPVLVLRKETERPEAVEAGTVKLAGTEENDIYNSIERLILNKAEYNEMSNAVNPYGDGKASQRIVDAIAEYFEEK